MPSPTEDHRRERVAYLPPRAVKARKLILRSQLGLPWMLTAILFGMVILAAGVLFLVKGGRPGAPWQRVAPVTSFTDAAVTETPLRAGQALVVDRRGGAVRAFVTAPGACPVQAAPGGFARPCSGQAWSGDGGRAPGMGPAGEPPLRAVPTTVAKGDLYVNAPGP